MMGLDEKDATTVTAYPNKKPTSKWTVLQTPNVL